MDKLRCYDPRTGDYRKTNNPALVFGQIMRGLPGMCGQLAGQERMEKRIAWLADYCDEMVNAQPKERTALEIHPPISIHFLDDGKVRIGAGAVIDYEQWLTPIVLDGIRVDREPLAHRITPLVRVHTGRCPNARCRGRDTLQDTELLADIKVGDSFVKTCDVCDHRWTEVYEEE